MLLQVENVSKAYRTAQQVLDHISLSVEEGEIVGLVGESGSGKSTLAKVIMQLESADKGTVLFQHQQVTKKQHKSFYENCQIIFQNASNAFNPKWTVKEILKEPLQYQKSVTDTYLQTMLEKVKLPKEILHALPSELSGGEKQRVNLLRSILVEPKLLICDEIVSSLDRLVQREIIDLLVTLNKERNMAILFISHDLKVVSYLCQRIYVMRSGKIVDECHRGADRFHFTDSYAKKLFQVLENG